MAINRIHLQVGKSGSTSKDKIKIANEGAQFVSEINFQLPDNLTSAYYSLVAIRPDSQAYIIELEHTHLGAKWTIDRTVSLFPGEWSVRLYGTMEPIVSIDQLRAQIFVSSPISCFVDAAPLDGDTPPIPPSPNWKLITSENIISARKNPDSGEFEYLTEGGWFTVDAQTDFAEITGLPRDNPNLKIEIEGLEQGISDALESANSYTDQEQLENVKLASGTTQIIQSDIALGEGHKIYGVRSDGTQHEIVGLNEYGAGQLQSEFGSPNDPICFNSAMVEGWSDDPHPKHTYKDLNGQTHDERIGWVSDIDAAQAAAEQTAQDYTDTEVAGSLASANQYTDDEVESALNEALSQAQDKIDKTVSGAGQLIGLSLAAGQPEASSASIELEQANVNTGSPSTQTLFLPVASEDQAGVMTAGFYLDHQDLKARVNGLESTSTIYEVDGLPTSPTDDQLTAAYLVASGATSVPDGANLYDKANMDFWRYAGGSQAWIDITADFEGIAPATNDAHGTFKGSTERGQIFMEADGTGSLVGMDSLDTADAVNAAAIALRAMDAQNLITLPTEDASKVTTGNRTVNAWITRFVAMSNGLRTLVDGKFAKPTGTTGQYLRGDGSPATFPTLGALAAKSTIADVDVAASANISQSKISGLIAALASKFPSPTGNNTQYLDGAGSPTAFPTHLSGDVASPPTAIGPTADVALAPGGSFDAMQIGVNGAAPIKRTVTAPDGMSVIRIPAKTNGSKAWLRICDGQAIQSSDTLLSFILDGSASYTQHSSNMLLVSFNIRTNSNSLAWMGPTLDVARLGNHPAELSNTKLGYTKGDDGLYSLYICVSSYSQNTSIFVLNAANRFSFPQALTWQTTEPVGIIYAETYDHREHQVGAYLQACTDLSALRIINNDGNTAVVVASDGAIQGKAINTQGYFYGMDGQLTQVTPGVLYEVSARVRKIAEGSTVGTVSFGVVGFLEDKITYCNAVGANATESQFRCVANNILLDPDSKWFTFTGYIRAPKQGETVGTTGTATDPNNPAIFHPNVAYMTPLFSINGSVGQNSTIELDYMKIVSLPEFTAVAYNKDMFSLYRGIGLGLYSSAPAGGSGGGAFFRVASWTKGDAFTCAQVTFAHGFYGSQHYSSENLFISGDVNKTTPVFVLSRNAAGAGSLPRYFYKQNGSSNTYDIFAWCSGGNGAGNWYAGVDSGILTSQLYFPADIISGQAYVAKGLPDSTYTEIVATKALVPVPPGAGTATLQSVDGVMSWV